jgi:hypothetical protein
MFLLILSAGTGIAQTPQLHTGATVYIEPMDGYETYLAAAIAKKQVPLVLVTDRTKADYIITSTVSQHSPSQPTVVVNNTTNVNSNGFPAGGGFPHAGYGASQGSTSASISVVDVHSSQIVFAYAAGKSANHQLQSTAEACAKHLKEFIIQPRK